MKSFPKLMQILKIQGGDYSCAKFQLHILFRNQLKKGSKFTSPIHPDQLSEHPAQIRVKL